MRAATAAVCVCLCAALAGCNTTQDTAGRIKIRSERVLDDRKPVNVTTVAPGIEVINTAMVRDRKQTAIAVTLKNSGTTSVNDLPLSLEVEKGKELIVVNGKPLKYFQSHAPALAPGEEATWVYTSRKPVPSGTITARVGVPVEPPTVAGSGKTELDVSGVTVVPSATGSSVVLKVHNTNDFAQYDVPVYAWAENGSRLAAAGDATVENLAPGETESVTVDLVGDPGSTEVRILAPATIFD